MAVGLTLNPKNIRIFRTHGDIHAVYTYLNDERCLILIPALRKDSAWYIAMESAAYLYDDDLYLWEQAHIACKVLGMEPSKRNITKIASIIHEGLPDLWKMKCKTDDEEDKISVGSVKIKYEGEVVLEEELKVDVPGADYV